MDTQITAVYNGFTHQPTCQPPPCHTPCQNYPQQVASSSTCNVQVPSFVSLVKSKTTSTCSSQSCLREVWYQVLDANVNPIYLAGMQIAETVSGTHTGNCTGSLQDYGTWITDATGTMTGPDYCWWWCAPTGCNADYSFSQRFTVNGLSVQVLSGSYAGSHNVVTIHCNNGQGSCASIVPTP
jgi:hypothetical protein